MIAHRVGINRPTRGERMTTTLVNTDDNHRKFYVITVDRRWVTLHWGRIGTRGQSQKIGFFCNVEADAFGRKKTSTKLDRGYVVVS